MSALLSRTPPLTLLLAVLTLVSGCRGISVVSPGSPTAALTDPVTLAPIPSATDAELLPLARYELTIGADGSFSGLTYIPDRAAAAFGQRYFLDLTRAAGNQASLFLTAQGAIRRGNNLALQLQVRHPFAPGDPLLPFSPTNRLDLHLFGVMAIALSDEPGIDPTAGQVPGVRLDPTLLVNPHGYTAAIPAALTNTATGQHPYRLFFREDPLVDASNLGEGNFTDADGYADLVNPRGFNVLPMGSTAQTELTIPLPNIGTRTITLLIAGHYIESMPPTTGDPEPLAGDAVYFARAAAGAAPPAVFASAVATGLAPKQATGEVAFSLDVLDWQHGKTADAGYPSAENPGGIPQASGIEKVQVFLPTLNATPAELIEPDNALTATGLFGNALRYSHTMTNALAPVGGTYYALVIAVDGAVPGTGNDTDRLKTIRGRTRSGTPFDLASSATLQVVPVVVPPGTQPPFVQLDPISPISVGQVLELTVRVCDPDGTATQLEWDFDYDGTFVADLTLPAPSASTSTLEIPPPNACLPTDGPITVAVRALDNDGLYSPVVCDDPPAAFAADFATCVISGGVPRNCRELVINPRTTPLIFATELNVSGSPSAQVPFADSRSSGQHGLVVSPNGNELWIAYHVIRQGFETGNVFVARSTDGGTTFATPVNVTAITPETPEQPGDPPPPGPVANHPSIALYTLDGKRHPVLVYAKGPFLDQDIAFRVSTDQGATFSTEARFTRTGNQGQPGVAVGPDNRIFVCFTDWDAPGGDQIVVARSQLGSTEVEFAQVNDVADDDGATVRWRTDYLVSQTAPAFAIDNANDRLVVAWSDAAVVGNDRARILADRSPLTALSFGSDVTVSPSPGAGEYHFEPSPVLRPGGQIAIAWRSAKIIDSDLAVDFWIAQNPTSSLLGGFSAPVKVSDATGTPRLGFAPSLAVDGAGTLYLAWQGAPTGITTNYDLFMDKSTDGLSWGTDQNDIDTEVPVAGDPRTEQALNPMVATTGCAVYVGWAGPATTSDTNNTWAVFVDTGT